MWTLILIDRFGFKKVVEWHTAPYAYRYLVLQPLSVKNYTDLTPTEQMVFRVTGRDDRNKIAYYEEVYN